MVAAGDTGTSKLATELRRGVLVLAVLSQLRTSQYGYSLRQALAERGMVIEEGPLYPSCGASRSRDCSRATGASKTDRPAATTR